MKGRIYQASSGSLCSPITLTVSILSKDEVSIDASYCALRDRRFLVESRRSIFEEWLPERSIKFWLVGVSSRPPFEQILSVIDSHIPNPSRRILVRRLPAESDIPDVVNPGKCNVLIVDVVRRVTVSNDKVRVESIIDVRYWSAIRTINWTKDKK